MSVLCRFIARRMTAANASYPYPRLARWIRDRAGVPDPFGGSR